MANNAIKSPVIHRFPIRSILLNFAAVALLGKKVNGSLFIIQDHYSKDISYDHFHIQHRLF